MDTNKNNPPAFPAHVVDPFNPQSAGMSLRDWFAGQAMPAFVAKVQSVKSEGEYQSLCKAWAEGLPDGKYSIGELLARQAYQTADRMLKVRAEGVGAPADAQPGA